VDDLSTTWMIGALGVLLVLSAFFSIAETAMMAFNRYRLKHLVAHGVSGALRVAELLKRTDRLLGGILIGNTLVIAAASTLSSLVAVRFLGHDKLAYAIGTLAISFLIIVFAEITPKVIGATFPERTALILSYPIKLTLRVLDPAAWFVNLFVGPLLWTLRIRTGGADAPKLSTEEIRTLVLESSSFMPKKHLAILLNLFDVGAVTVQDIMVPRARIESIKLEDDIETIAHQLATSYHQRLPVFRDALGEVVGVLHLRRVLAPLREGALDQALLESLVVQPYFVPATTPVLAQLQYFQENRERMALVVDEYGELMGLVTLEDILEEIVGDISDEHDVPVPGVRPQPDGSVNVDGAVPIRDLNRAMDWNLPDAEATTIAGLVIHEARSIPDVGQTFTFHGFRFNVLRKQRNRITALRIMPLVRKPVPLARAS
jgi:magnesium and cobalt exporter, CNNM family